MEFQDIWIIVLAVSTPIAGVVGFSIQLKNVKKLRLENKKLELDIIKIKRDIEKSEQRIVEPSLEEVIKFNEKPLFSQESSSFSVKRNDDDYKPEKKPFPPLEDILLILGIIIFLSYFVYDLYRVFMWVWNAF